MTNTPIVPISQVDTSSFTPAQLQAFNNAKALIPSSGAMGNPDPITSINSGNMGTQGNINLPQTPTGQNPSPLIAAGNAMITANGVGSYSPTGASTNPDMNASLQALLAQVNNQPASATDQYNTDYAASGIDQKQAQLNTNSQAVLNAQSKLQGINAQLAGITAQGQAATIAARGEGGLVSTYDAGSAEIARQNALQALPLQAQALGAQAEVAAAQGNAQLSEQILQQAQSHLDQQFQIHQQDAQAQYQYKANLIQSVYQYATAQEKAALDTKKNEADQNFQLQKMAIQNQYDIANTKLKAALNPPSASLGTAAQQTVATYAARIEQSNPTLTSLTPDILKMSPASFEVQKNLPSSIQSSAVQSYMQASRNFINAVLRRESGAVISPTEFADAQAQYLPVPGDSPNVLAQKAQNRLIVQNSFKNGAGPAYQSINDLIGPAPSSTVSPDELKNYTFATASSGSTSAQPGFFQKVLGFFGL